MFNYFGLAITKKWWCFCSQVHHLNSEESSYKSHFSMCKIIVCIYVFIALSQLSRHSLHFPIFVEIDPKSRPSKLVVKRIYNPASRLILYQGKQTTSLHLAFVVLTFNRWSIINVLTTSYGGRAEICAPVFQDFSLYQQLYAIYSIMVS